MENKFDTMNKLSSAIGNLNDIGHKVSKGSISNEEVINQLKDVEKILHELIQKYCVQ